jgi:hypothetical protein
MAMSVRTVIRCWPIASLLFAIHTLLVIAFYICWVLSAWDVERDMSWLIMAFVDFPIFFAYIPLVNNASGDVFALTSILFGGLEWALVGFALDLACRRSIRKRALRGTQDI